MNELFKRRYLLVYKVKENREQLDYAADQCFQIIQIVQTIRQIIKFGTIFTLKNERTNKIIKN